MAAGGNHIEADALTSALTRLQLRDITTGPVTGAIEAAVAGVVGVFGVDGAGLMFIDSEDALRYVAATDEPSRVLESAQEQLGQGPCVDSLIYGTAFETADITADERWPTIGEIVGPVGVRAVIGVPLRLGGASVGSLNAYRSEPYEWDDSERAALRAFNRTIEAVLGQAILAERHEAVVDQLQHALEHRVAIERAIGLLMGRHGLDAVDAYNRIRTAARTHRVRAAAVAEQLLAGEIADL